MKIRLLCEGATEKAFLPTLRAFLRPRLNDKMPRMLLRSGPGGRIPKGDKLRRIVEIGLQDADAVIALTDVYTGTQDFTDAADAKQKMRAWVGDEPRFYPHAAQHDFEAWLLPYWSRIQHLAGHNRNPPAGMPESVNHQNPPSKHIQAIYEAGTCRDSYSKPRDAARILEGRDLTIAADACPELKAFLNTILTLCEGELLV